jgi:hypothetical protein
MDIFTTQLTRVLAVPIKPTSLKVKALVKDAESNKLKEDHDQFDNHAYYFKKAIDNIYYNDDDSQKKEEQATKRLTKDIALNNTENVSNEHGNLDDKKEDDHKGHNLDLYA